MTQIKLIASDLDGTLIPEGTQQLEPGFMDILKKVLDAGIEFYAASGRPYGAMTHVFREVHDRVGYICENGAIVKEQEKDTYLQKLPAELAEQIAKELARNPLTEIFISGVSTAYVLSENPWFHDLMRSIVKENLRFVDRYEEIGEPVVKLAMYVHDFEQNAARVREELTEKYGYYFNLAYTGNGWLDLIPKNSGKGVALQALMERKGLKPEEIMVFGDNENDISMLQLTPNSFAMTHSKPHVKAQAGHVCDHVTNVLQSYMKCGKI